MSDHFREISTALDALITEAKQSPRPRVSEHTDAARLEALRDSMRPRVEGEVLTASVVRTFAMGDVDPLPADCQRLAADWLALTAEVERLRKFAEKMISPCEWGPTAFVTDDEADISDWAVSCGILVERVHPQPCEVEGCECDGSPTLLYFAWSPEAAALALTTNAPEATDG